jgi:hypothetical protein
MKNTGLTYKTLIITLLALIQFQTIHGQKKSKELGWWQKDWMVNASVGATLAMGDMKFAWDGNADVKPGYSIWFGKQLTPSFSLRFQAINSRLSGTGMLFQTSENKEVPAEFLASMFEYNLSAQYYFFKKEPENTRPRSWNLYATAGAGYTHWITDAYSLVDGSLITRNGYKPFGKGINGRTLEGVFPVGLGADILLIPNLNLNLESNLHTVTSDKLDNKISGFAYDQYLYTSAGLTYKFNANIKLFEPKKIELARYRSDPDFLPLRYTHFFSTTGGAVDPLMALKQPSMTEKIPQKIYAEPEVNITLQFKNAGREGVLDLDFAFPPDFQMEVANKKKFKITTNGQGANIQYKVDAIDTNRVNTFRLLTASVPNGSYPFLLTARFVAYSGEVFHFKEMEYIDKDAKGRNYASGLDSLPEGLLSGIKFRVQILSSKGQPIPQNKITQMFPEEKDVREEHDKGWYYYTTGLFATREEADAYKEKLENETGHKGMFSVMYQNDKRSHNMQNIYEGYQSEMGQFDALGKSNRKGIAQGNSNRVDEYRVRFYTVQEFRASIAELETRMGTEEVITEVINGETYYYFAGSFRKRNVAKAYAEYLRDKIGFSEATVVAFSKGQPVEGN